MGVAPKDFKFKATFAAPPIRFSFLSMVTMGTGASGEMRSTFPHMYASIITSPITSTLSWSKASNIFCNSSVVTGIIVSYAKLF